MVSIVSEEKDENVSNRITIKSIAEDLGISHMTVSRALSNHPNVSEEKRATILEYATKVGYVKSAAATAIRGDGTRIVGLLLPNLVNEFYARFANSLTLLCEKQGWHLTIHLTNDDGELEQSSIRRLRELQASTVIMVPTPDQPENDLFQTQDIRVIQLIRTRAMSFPSTALLIDDGASIAKAVTHLVQAGHTHIGYIGSYKMLSSGQQRLKAFREAMHWCNLDVDEALIRTAPPSFEMGHQSALSIMDNSAEVSALVCGGFEISNGALDACLRRGLRMPEDLAFVGFGDPSFYQWIGGGITTIVVPVDELASQAIDLMSQKLLGAETQKVVFKTSFLLRQSA